MKYAIKCKVGRYSVAVGNRVYEAGSAHFR